MLKCSSSLKWKYRGSSYFDLYASRNSKGIYIFADYYTKTDYSGASNWWEGNNFEFRFNSPTGVLTNDTEPENNKHQYWISNYANGGHSNMTSQFVSTPALNEETGYYEIKFEAFISYSKASIDANTPVGFTAGYNPGGIAWTPGPHFATGDFVNTSKITTDGIVHYYTEDVMCSEGHSYTSKVTTPVTCVTDGVTTFTCKWCGHSYTEPIIAVGEHNFNETIEHVAATCTSAGYEVLGCSGCDEEKRHEFPINPSNHATAYNYATGAWDCCDEENYAVKDRYNSGGWGDVNTWTYLIKNLEGDFVVTATFDLESNSITGNWWHGALPIVQHALPEGVPGQGSPWVTRFDWWGWCDPWETGDKLTSDFNNMADDAGNRDIWWSNSEGNNVTGEEFETAMTKSTIEWKCTRTGTVILNEFTIHSQSGSVYTFWSKATDVATDRNINLALASEYARYTVKSVVKA